jgi:hypothetical protein
MKEKLYLSISEPCHEDWNKMTAVEQGRFCSSCQKNVVDFTNKSDKEIISFFNNYNGSTCGRFNDEQLDRPIQQIKLKPASSFLKYAAGLLMPAFLFAIKVKGQSKEQFQQQTSKQMCMPSPKVANIMLGKVASNHQKLIEIHGSVIDEITKEPLPGVSVMIKETNQGVVTDANGRYSIYITSKKAVVQFSSIGYEMKEIKSVELNKTTGVVVKMKSGATHLSGEVIVVGYPVRKVSGMTGAVSIIRSTRFSFLDTLLPAKVKIYPNPVAPSGTINISFPNVKHGRYQLRLLNATGQLFYSFQKQINGKNETEQIYLNDKILPGIYIVQVMDEQKKLIQSSKIVVQ